ncbi:MAG: PspC domain-containing protein [Methanoregula sp.]|jgi:phage shock protein PspC (stress-responsive transcriptional regulator)|nr:PspC domain-containing protein [Methanoregula sp.]
MKRLFRSKKERILGGVCGGLGEHLDIDPTVIRLVWALGSLISLGTGLIIYIIAWVLIPDECPADTGNSASGMEKQV